MALSYNWENSSTATKARCCYLHALTCPGGVVLTPGGAFLVAGRDFTQPISQELVRRPPPARHRQQRLAPAALVLATNYYRTRPEPMPAH